MAPLNRARVFADLLARDERTLRVTIDLLMTVVANLGVVDARSHAADARNLLARVTTQLASTQQRLAAARADADRIDADERRAAENGPLTGWHERRGHGDDGPR